MRLHFFDLYLRTSVHLISQSGGCRTNSDRYYLNAWVQPTDQRFRKPFLPPSSNLLSLTQAHSSQGFTETRTWLE